MRGHERRRPEETLLYRVEYERVALAEERGGLPSFVMREFDEYLRCGILEHGRASMLRALRPPDGGRLLMQAERLLSIVHRASHVRYCGALGG